MSKVSEAASWIMWHLVTHPAHGYSQPNRMGDGTREAIDVPGWGKVTIAGGDRDCSSAVIECYRALGINVGGATYTGNERQCLLSTGLFEEVPLYGPSFDGDILLREGHTEMVVGDTRWQAGFRRSERHSITGAKGDQDGLESTYSALRLSEWSHKIRYYGPDDPRKGATKTREKNVRNIKVGDWWGNMIVSQGESGKVVKLIQRALIARGHSCGDAGADGQFGGNTASAVLAFQRANGLTADAVVGVLTATKLFS